MADPTVTVRLGQTAGAYDPLSGVTWTNISAYHRGTKTKSGRQHELARVEAGTAKIILNNRDRRFDPTNSAGPYWPHLRPGNLIHVYASYGVVTYDLFLGYVDDWSPAATSIADSDVTIDCTDAFELWAINDLPSSPWQMMVRSDDPKLWLRLSDGGGSGDTAAADFSGHHIDGQYQGGPSHVPGLVVGDSDQATNFAHAANQRVSLPYKGLISGFPFTVECWLSTTLNHSEYKVVFDGEAGPVGGDTYLTLVIQDTGPNAGKVVALIGYAGTASICVSGQTVDNGQPHHIVWVATSASSWKIYVDGVDTSSMVVTGLSSFPVGLDIGYAVGSTPASAFGDYGLDGVIDEFVLYDGVALSGARVAAHYEAGSTGWGGDLFGARVNRILDWIGWPLYGRNIDGGAVDLVAGTPGATVLGHMQALTDTEGGIVYIGPNGFVEARDRNYLLTASTSTTSQCTLGDGGGAEIPYLLPADPSLDRLDLWNRVQVTRQGGTTQQVDDDASQATYGTRTLTRSGTLHAGDDDALYMSQRLLDTFSEPIARVRSVSFTPKSSTVTDAWPHALGRKLLDRVTFKRRPVGGGPVFTQEALIEGIEHEIDPGRLWKTTWHLEAADTRTYWTLGTSALGSDTRLYY